MFRACVFGVFGMGFLENLWVRAMPAGCINSFWGLVFVLSRKLLVSN